MSYPAPRYTGDKGEVSAAYRPAGTPPEVSVERDLPDGQGVTWTRTTYLASSAPTGRPSVPSTGGEFGLYHVDMGPKSGGPSTHFHRSIAESFYFLSGTVQVFDGERWIEATAGDFLYVPSGGLHGFGNYSDEPASLLMLFTPGAPREEYFEQVSKLGQLSPEERAEFLLRHDSFFV